MDDTYRRPQSEEVTAHFYAEVINGPWRTWESCWIMRLETFGSDTEIVLVSCNGIYILSTVV